MCVWGGAACDVRAGGSPGPTPWSAAGEGVLRREDVSGANQTTDHTLLQAGPGDPPDPILQSNFTIISYTHTNTLAGAGIALQAGGRYACMRPPTASYVIALRGTPVSSHDKGCRDNVDSVRPELPGDDSTPGYMILIC